MMLELGKAVYIQELEGPFLKRSKDFFLCAPIGMSFCRSVSHPLLPCLMTSAPSTLHAASPLTAAGLISGPRLREIGNL